MILKSVCLHSLTRQEQSKSAWEQKSKCNMMVLGGISRKKIFVDLFFFCYLKGFIYMLCSSQIENCLIFWKLLLWELVSDKLAWKVMSVLP